MFKNELAETLPLDGVWEFSLGENAPWSMIRVPGCWEEQGFSKLIDGPARYRKLINIPSHWRGLNIFAGFNAVSYACRAWLNGVEVGYHEGMWTSFTFDVTAAARPGESNLLELEVYKPGKRFPVRSSLAGFLPDVATTFGGLWQSAWLQATQVSLDGLRIVPEIDTQTLHIQCNQGQAGAYSFNDVSAAKWLVEIFHGMELLTQRRLPLTDEKRLDASLTVPDPIMWSPAHPTLYTVRISLVVRDERLACLSQRIGFRRLSADGQQLLLNGEAFLIRGILSWGWQPDRIAPAFNPEQAREEIRRVRSLGFNAIKLCLFVPNPAYFDIADEEGMLLWEELPLWLPEVTPKLSLLAPQEYADIVSQVQSHPSIVVYSLGCELDKSVDANLLERLNEAVRQTVSDVLVCDNSGSGESYGGLDDDTSDFSDYHPYYDLHYFEPLLNNWRRDWQRSRPWIFGEFCDSDTFRDLDELTNANGGVKPWWLTTDNPVTSWRPESLAMVQEQERLTQARLGFSTQELIKVSYAQSLVVRKYTLESLRRRSGIGGYIITGLRDTPISTSGIWDDFSRPKWPSSEFRPFNDEAILSLEVDRRRIWSYGGDRPVNLDAHNLWSGEPWRWRIILSYTGSSIPPGSEFSWSLVDHDGDTTASGATSLPFIIYPGQPRQAGVIECLLPQVKTAVEWHLEARLSGGGIDVTNHWPVWLYPPLAELPPNLAIIDPTHSLDDCGDWLTPVPRIQIEDRLQDFDIILTTIWHAGLQKGMESGCKVLLLQQGTGPLPVHRCPFWREAIQLFYDHPFWKTFPQRGYSDMQFFGIANDIAFDTPNLAHSFGFLADIRPILRRLDARQFTIADYIFEARAGKGILLACALRLQGGLGVQPFGWKRNVAGAAMLSSLLNILKKRQS